jgi:hypothetical protein
MMEDSEFPRRQAQCNVSCVVAMSNDDVVSRFLAEKKHQGPLLILGKPSPVANRLSRIHVSPAPIFVPDSQ